MIYESQNIKFSSAGDKSYGYVSKSGYLLVQANDRGNNHIVMSIGQNADTVYIIWLEGSHNATYPIWLLWIKH